MPNRLLEVQNFGQSIWIDTLSRSLLDSSALRERIESDGVRGFVADSADFALRIPMAADIDSLNIATAAGIALHHCARLPARKASRRGDP